MCPRERLVLISISTVLSLLRKDWATYLFVLYYCYLLFVLLPCQKTTKNPFAKYSQGFPAPYHCSAPSAPRWDRHSYLSKVLRYTPILLGHQDYFLAPLPGSEALLKSGTGKGNFYCEYYFCYCLLLCFQYG